jgi:hypothetical protein
MPVLKGKVKNEPRQETIDALTTELQESGKAKHFPLWNLPDREDPENPDHFHPDWSMAQLELETAFANIGAGGRIAAAGRMGKDHRHYLAEVIDDADSYEAVAAVVRAEQDSEAKRPLSEFLTHTLSMAYGQATVAQDTTVVGFIAYELGTRSAGRRAYEKGFTSLPHVWERDPQYLSDVCPTCQSPVGQLMVNNRVIGIRSINAADKIREEWRDLIDWVPEANHIAECEHYEEGDEEAPFLTERYLYNLLGKEDARSLLGRVRRLGHVLGFDGRDF